MDMNRIVGTNSKTVYYGGLVAAVVFLLASQFILSVVLPPYGPTAPVGLLALGMALTALAVASAGVMIYGMSLRSKGK